MSRSFSIPTPPASTILLSDQLPSPAQFLLFHCLIERLGRNKGKNRANDTVQDRPAKTVILSIDEGPAKWAAVLAKSSVSLNQQPSVVFIDALSKLLTSQPQSGNQEPFDLHPFFERIKSEIEDASSGESSSSCPLVIIDSLGTLSWIGVSDEEIKRFVRAVRALCLKTKSTLIIRHHLLQPSNPVQNAPDALTDFLLKVSTYHVEVMPLASGKSGGVSGEVALHLGPSALLSSDNANYPPVIPRSHALQYHIASDLIGGGGIKWFERGTSVGIVL